MAEDDEVWKKKLTKEQYHVTREKGTEKPFSSELLNNQKPGEYTCVCCGEKLFVSDTKFDSHCGWPAFYASEDGKVKRTEDRSHNMIRVEVTCSKCGAHLGHVFEDGPEPTGERYCINGVALKFKQKK